MNPPPDRKTMHRMEERRRGETHHLSSDANDGWVGVGGVRGGGGGPVFPSPLGWRVSPFPNLLLLLLLAVTRSSGELHTCASQPPATQSVG